ncbi:hypothetical protein N7474_000655 [Penicillium riverlandense]|uniref:uncharacterized protein n=1 Tax=Penicillium riverlandense TaxID=1903569 RepID=UPI0025494C96|nr:uncharacterized protein N7474_000655 [Penicillium riverlandense]KAJ5832344.1 hypothetical protein N7474_000655 [Penicillium riverlandense]
MCKRAFLANHENLNKGSDDRLHDILCKLDYRPHCSRRRNNGVADHVHPGGLLGPKQSKKPVLSESPSNQSSGKAAKSSRPHQTATPESKPRRRPKAADKKPSSKTALVATDAGFARFLREHSSPRHQRVTAGGRIVPMQPNSIPPLDRSLPENWQGQPSTATESADEHFQSAGVTEHGIHLEYLGPYAPEFVPMQTQILPPPTLSTTTPVQSPIIVTSQTQSLSQSALTPSEMLGVNPIPFRTMSQVAAQTNGAAYMAPLPEVGGDPWTDWPQVPGQGLSAQNHSWDNWAPMTANATSFTTPQQAGTAASYVNPNLLQATMFTDTTQLAQQHGVALQPTWQDNQHRLILQCVRHYTPDLIHTMSRYAFRGFNRAHVTVASMDRQQAIDPGAGRDWNFTALRLQHVRDRGQFDEMATWLQFEPEPLEIIGNEQESTAGPSSEILSGTTGVQPGSALGTTGVFSGAYGNQNIAVPVGTELQSQEQMNSMELGSRPWLVTSHGSADDFHVEDEDGTNEDVMNMNFPEDEGFVSQVADAPVNWSNTVPRNFGSTILSSIRENENEETASDPGDVLPTTTGPESFADSN